MKEADIGREKDGILSLSLSLSLSAGFQRIFCHRNT